MARRLRTILVVRMTRWLGLYVLTTLHVLVYAHNSGGALSATCTMVSTIQNKIIDPIEKWKQQSMSEHTSRPFVTLSFAQSVDGKIAMYLDDNIENSDDNNHLPCTTANYPLSGPESMLVTHALRSIHDGILVGGRTLATDNPRLTNRLWHVPSDASQPRPIVLDTHLRYIRQCWENGSVLKAKNLIVCSSHQAAHSWYSSSQHQDMLAKDSNITILPCDTGPNGHLELKGLLFQLKTKFGIRSLMVEGGSTILSSFVQQADLVDCFCLTIAPKILGSQGLPAFVTHHHFPAKRTSSSHMDKIGLLELRDIQWVPMGNDSILLARRANKTTFDGIEKR